VFFAKSVQRIERNEDAPRSCAKSGVRVRKLLKMGQLYAVSVAPGERVRIRRETGRVPDHLTVSIEGGAQQFE